jgi:hypothetical protein
MDLAATPTRMTTLPVVEHHVDELIDAVFDEFPMLEVFFLFLEEDVYSTLAVGHGYLTSIVLHKLSVIIIGVAGLSPHSETRNGARTAKFATAVEAHQAQEPSVPMAVPTGLRRTVLL